MEWREKVEREGVETSRRNGRDHRNSFIHKLDTETTSYFFTNFPEGVKAMDLWTKFARFGRVGEVYIPNKLDKQGKRFGFVKFWEIADATEFLSRLGDIWVDSFKLRVNLSKFRKGESKAANKAEVPELSKMTMAQRQAGRSFKVALVEGTTSRQPSNVAIPAKEEVVWEVEVDTNALAKLKGAFVGFLAEHGDCKLIQQQFLMHGYHNLKVSPLGYKKVLLSSSVEEEVKEVAESMGWWCSL